jgi:hypothetical protein
MVLYLCLGCTCSAATAAGRLGGFTVMLSQSGRFSAAQFSMRSMMLGAAPTQAYIRGSFLCEGMFNTTAIRA